VGGGGPAAPPVAADAGPGRTQLPDLLRGVRAFFYKVDADAQRRLRRLIVGYGG
jgi:hypothetical protein